MNKFKPGDLVRVSLPEQGNVPRIARVIGLFPGGARVTDWEHESGAIAGGWPIGDEYLSRAMLNDVFKVGDYLLARRQIVEDFGGGQKRKTNMFLRMVIGHFSVNGTRAYSITREGTLVVDMHDGNPWEIYPGDADSWEHRVA